MLWFRSAPNSLESQFVGRAKAPAPWVTWVLFAIAAAALTYSLGAAPLMEPDEGRNAEKAREVLLLNDWVTPHVNFQPVLDKPMFFYWLIALSFKFFGVSEFAARAPSVLAALACLALVYVFARRFFGGWQAVASVVVLLTAVEFFALGRVVIFDMTLTLAQTAALCAFFAALHTEPARQRLLYCGALYASLAVGTLVKGLVGVVVPGAVFFFFLALTKNWAALRRLHLVPGLLLFLALVLPWYLLAEARNPGYLHYYFVEEHFGRYTGDEFERGQPWYFYFGVVALGFMPWTALLPALVRHHWRRNLDDRNLFLILWAVVPFMFFSVSTSKLAHYILPIFPALAILMGVHLISALAAPRRVRLNGLLLVAVQCCALGYLLLGAFMPRILANSIRGVHDQIGMFLWGYGILALLVAMLFAFDRSAKSWFGMRLQIAASAMLLGVFLVFMARMMTVVAPERSARDLASAVAHHLPPGGQVVFHDTFLFGMNYYLASNRPVWYVTHERKKSTFLGNFRALGRGADSAKSSQGVDDGMFTFDEFAQIWGQRPEPLLVIVKTKNLKRLEANVGAVARVGAVDEYTLARRP